MISVTPWRGKLGDMCLSTDKLGVLYQISGKSQRKKQKTEFSRQETE
jgi:hypothetical protein